MKTSERLLWRIYVCDVLDQDLGDIQRLKSSRTARRSVRWHLSRIVVSTRALSGSKTRDQLLQPSQPLQREAENEGGPELRARLGQNCSLSKTSSASTISGMWTEERVSSCPGDWNVVGNCRGAETMNRGALPSARLKRRNEAGSIQARNVISRRKH